MDGAQQIVDAIYETANDTLEESKSDFAELGIELRTLTNANYPEEIARLQSELLENVDDYVRQKADEQLCERVEEAAHEQVVAAVETAAREQVAAQVQAGAEQQVRVQA